MSYFTSYKKTLTELNRSDSESLFSTQSSPQAELAKENASPAGRGFERSEKPSTSDPADETAAWFVWCSGSIGDCGSPGPGSIPGTDPSRFRAAPSSLGGCDGRFANANLQSTGKISGVCKGTESPAPELRRIAVATRRVSDCAGCGFAC